MKSTTSISLSAGDLIQAKRDWLTVAHINAAFPNADAYVRFLRGEGSGSAPAAAPAPALPAASTTSAGRRPQWKAEGFSTPAGWLYFHMGVAKGAIQPGKDRGY